MPGAVCRRRSLTALFLVAALGLGGCVFRPSAEPVSDGPLKIGFVNGGSTQFHTCLQRAVVKTARNNFAEIYTADSRQDAERELSNIQDMIERQVDVIIVQTVSTQALKQDIAKAKKADIPIFLTSVTADPSDILGAVVVDLKAVGKLDAEWIWKDADGRSAEVGVIAGAPGAASDVLVGSFIGALPSNAQVVANQPGMFDAEKARQVAASMIQEHPDLDYVFIANEQMAFAARKSFDAAGATDVKIVTVNGTDEGLAALKDGRFAATVSNSAADTGKLAVENAIAMMRGEEVDKVDNTPILLTTKDNADRAPLYCIQG
ncbi:sugar ABC transporter substrate-binding protein [Streptomyces antibioticus]|uniref:Sugar ABC transporter substrate-binding protein n=1 Tax=Streptomyces antibioticus TaxID=1890 RepID=A0AAE6Y2X2_STRAT|nr:sugar ABC transporter substrate-binding protein [Streptomyces antibioticus]